MKDLSLHLLDVLENSVKAGARHVRVTFGWAGTVLRIVLEDDGPGLPPEIAVSPTDPFRTTRTERKVGLGLALLEQAAADGGGDLKVFSTPGRGVRLEATFDLSTVDAKPVGDLCESLTSAACAWPETALSVSTEDGNMILDMEEVSAVLDGMDPGHPAARRFVSDSLSEGLAELHGWVERVFHLGPGLPGQSSVDREGDSRSAAEETAEAIHKP